MSDVMRAIVVDPDAPARLALADVDLADPTAHQAVVRVEASSLNRGDLLAAQQADAGWRPGHDIAGTVLEAAADGTGPAVGERVVGLLDSAAWSQRVVADTDRLARIPDEVTASQASTLPTAGLTAHRALEQGGLLLGKRVLITGSTGGVGLFAHQLATRAGARVVGTSRRPEHEAAVRELGADDVVVGEDLSAARDLGPFDLVVESLGGAALATALTMLTPGGTCVSFGWSASPEVPLDLRQFLAVGGGRLYGLRMYHELVKRPASGDLELLGSMVAADTLHVPIEVEEPWDHVSDLGQRLLDRTFTGKAVMRIE